MPCARRSCTVLAVAGHGSWRSIVLAGSSSHSRWIYVACLCHMSRGNACMSAAVRPSVQMRPNRSLRPPRLRAFSRFSRRCKPHPPAPLCHPLCHQWHPPRLTRGLRFGLSLLSAFVYSLVRCRSTAGCCFAYDDTYDHICRHTLIYSPRVFSETALHHYMLSCRLDT